MRLVLPGFCLVLVVASVAACGPDDPAGDAMEAEGEAETAATTSDYEVVLGNAITDTLRGEAGFGVVLEPESQRKRFIIRLKSDFDFAGGFVLARRDTTLPEQGTFDLELSGDSLAVAPESEFLLFYREGMLRDLRGASGSLELTTVTDTLIAGRFDARLEGRVAGLDRADGEAEVHAVGEFRAERGLDGFVIGL